MTTADVLKGVAIFIFSPLNVALMLFIGAAVLRFKSALKWASRCRTIALIWLFIFSQQYTADLLLHPLESKPVKNISTLVAPDYIWVLACYYDTDNQGPPLNAWSNCSLQRLVEAMRLYHYSDAPILLTGGNFLADPAIDYADQAKAMLMSLGVPERKIIAVNEGESTFSEYQAISEKIKDKHMWVVSSATHGDRVISMASSSTNKLVFFPSNQFGDSDLTPYLSWPSLYALEANRHAMYEYGAWVKYNLLQK